MPSCYCIIILYPETGNLSDIPVQVVSICVTEFAQWQAVVSTKNVMAFNSIKLCRKNKIDKITVDFLQEAVTFIVSATCTPNLVDGKVLNFYPGM